MAEGKTILQSLHRRWMLQGLAFCVLLSVAVSLLLLMVLHRWGYDRLWFGGLLFGVMCCLAVLLFPSWRLTLADAARILDKHVPELEESSSLLLKPDGELGALEKLQATRIAARLHGVKLPHPLRKRLLFGTCCVGVVVVVWVAMAAGRVGIDPVIRRALPPVVKPVVAGVRAVTVRITPPAYTGRTMRSQQDLNLQVEAGALVSWEIRTDLPVEGIQFIFNDSIHVALKAGDTNHTLWRLSNVAGRSGFYQLKMPSGPSGLYKIEVIRDEAPRISIRTPKAYTIVDIGESRKIPMVVKVQDDYGVSDATVVATIATGAGEAVKFSEKILSFDRAFTGGQTVYDLQRTLNLDALGVHPGDELYYYCRAKDNHGQESRSDMYIISLPDTAKLLSLEGITMGLDVKPELFRSERQIIIETEQLLRGKDSMSVQAFNDKSNDLGIDQKLLRLRYGKFLGEESEEGGPGESFSAAGSSPADFGNAAKVKDAFTDKHDNAEDATFFEPAIKQQLKATLTEMWNAELRLRTYKPQEALPYEYKALRLLKDLQQKSRAYVAKTGVRVTPLDLKKRLTGKLDEILEPRKEDMISREPTTEDKLRMALSILEGGAYSQTALGILQEVGRELGKQAIAHPGEFLEGFQALRRVMAGGAAQGDGGRKGDEDRRGDDWKRSDHKDRGLAQRAIQKMLSVPEANPSIRKGAADAGLSQLYFSNVNKQ